MSISLSSISLSILPSSSSRGPMYCPGLRGEGNGSIGRGRSGSGRLGRSNRGPVDPVGSSVFQGFHRARPCFFPVGMVGVRGLKTTFQSRNSSIVQSLKSLRISPDHQSGRGSYTMPSSRLHDPSSALLEKC